MSDMAMKYEDWLRGCVYHDGRKGNVYLPCDTVLEIADWIEAHRDVAPVVRCKECRWYVRSMIKQDGTLDERYKPDWCDLYRRVREETYFCADGERKDDDD